MRSGSRECSPDPIRSRRPGDSLHANHVRLAYREAQNQTARRPLQSPAVGCHLLATAGGNGRLNENQRNRWRGAGTAVVHHPTPMAGRLAISCGGLLATPQSRFAQAAPRLGHTVRPLSLTQAPPPPAHSCVGRQRAEPQFRIEGGRQDWPRRHSQKK